MKNHI